MPSCDIPNWIVMASTHSTLALIEQSHVIPKQAVKVSMNSESMSKSKVNMPILYQSLLVKSSNPLPHQLRWLAVLDSKRKESLFLLESALHANRFFILGNFIYPQKVT